MDETTRNALIQALIAKNIIISTLIYYVLLKLFHFFTQKIILKNTKEKVLVDDEKICHLPKLANGVLFMIAATFGIWAAYILWPYFLHKDYIFTNINNVKDMITYLYHIIFVLFIISTYIIIFIGCCNYRVIITNKRIMISRIFKDPNKIPKHQDIWAKDISSLEVIYYNQIIKVRTQNETFTLIRGLNDPKSVMNKIQNCLEIKN